MVKKSLYLLLIIHLSNRFTSGSLNNSKLLKMPTITGFDRNKLLEYIENYMNNFSSKVFCSQYCSNCAFRNSNIYDKYTPFTCAYLIYLQRAILSYICSERK